MPRFLPGYFICTYFPVIIRIGKAGQNKFRNKVTSIKKLICIILVLTAALSFSACGSKDEPGFTLGFICIGKGDAFLLQCPDGSNYMVDTGKTEDFPQIGRYLSLKGVSHLDGIFLSHGHRDHAGGLDYIMSVFPTDRVYMSAADDASYSRIDPGAVCLRHGSELVKLKGGEILNLGGGVSCSIWLPDTVDYENENNNSLVMLICFGQRRFLMMGDAELNEEKLLLESGFDVKADVLKLGHHGESDASSTDFLNAVSPSLGLIAGNESENPDSVNETISSRLSQRGIEALYSDPGIPGWEIFCDGETIELSRLIDRGGLPELSLSVSEFDRKGQRIVIRNNSDTAADLSRCTLFSDAESCAFIFPGGTVLQSGEETAVACRGHEIPEDLIWDEDKVWHKKKGRAVIYDPSFIEICSDP